MILDVSCGNESEEAQVYQASGVKLIDLIRGIPPKEDLVLSKVDVNEAGTKDGIYLQLPKHYDEELSIFVPPTKLYSIVSTTYLLFYSVKLSIGYLDGRALAGSVRENMKKINFLRNES